MKKTKKKEKHEVKIKIVYLFVRLVLVFNFVLPNFVWAKEAVVKVGVLHLVTKFIGCTTPTPFVAPPPTPAAADVGEQPMILVPPTTAAAAAAAVTALVVPFLNEDKLGPRPPPSLELIDHKTRCVLIFKNIKALNFLDMFVFIR